MKRRHFLLSAIAMGVTTVAAKTKYFATNHNKKILIVYYSWSGNTRETANQIQDLTGGDIFEVITEKAYPTDYNDTVDQAKKEIESGIKPTIQGKVDHIDSYDVIFVGTPNWWSTIAPPIATFLTEHKLAGKKVIPFCTHGGGGRARCFSDTQKLCPDSIFGEGLVISGTRAAAAKNQVEKWLRDSKFNLNYLI